MPPASNGSQRRSLLFPLISPATPTLPHSSSDTASPRTSSASRSSRVFFLPLAHDLLVRARCNRLGCRQPAAAGPVTCSAGRPPSPPSPRSSLASGAGGELRLQVAHVPTPGNIGLGPTYARGLPPYFCIASLYAFRPRRAFLPCLFKLGTRTCIRCFKVGWGNNASFVVLQPARHTGGIASAKADEEYHDECKH